MRKDASVGLAIALWVWAPGPGAAGLALMQDTARVQVLAGGHLFRPLRADPKQPEFTAAYLWATAVGRTNQVASVGLGEEIGLVRDTAGRWELSVSAGVFSQFDMSTPSYNLLNTDFVIGFPFTQLLVGVALRGRLYHQSSHLGDEYLLESGASRVNYSYEALEVLASRDQGPFRFYGGGEYLVRRDPKGLKPGVLHWGVEWVRARGRPFGAFGHGRPFAALDVKSFQERRWRIGWDARLGYEFATTAPGARRWTIALRGYRGPSPYGQFYETDVRTVGAGIGFGL